MGDQGHVPATLPLGKTQYPLYRKLVAPQYRSGRLRKISSPNRVTRKKYYLQNFSHNYDHKKMARML